MASTMDLTSAGAALLSLRRRGACDAELGLAAALQAALPGAPEAGEAPVDVAHATAAVDGLLSSERWECRAAALLAGSELLRPGGSHRLGADAAALDGLARHLADHAEANLEHREPRVRASVVQLLEQLSLRDGPAAWERFGEVLCGIVDKSFDLDAEERAATQDEIAAQQMQAGGDAPPSPGSGDGARSRSSSFGSAGTALSALVHETIGWKALETSMRGLQALVRGYGPSLVSDGRLEWQDDYLLRLVCERALVHENRYVREVGYDLAAAIVECICTHTDGARDAHTDALCQAIARGLSDNWSQVRYAASVAARALVLGLRPEHRIAYDPTLVPRLCLNRYYLAAGVRLYSQETWRRAYGTEGVATVAANAGAVAAFYEEQSRANNHGVREAACHAIAELAAKVPLEALGPHVDGLLASLVDCFRDDSWPVRDAACVASGRFVRNFPDESLPRRQELQELWFAHLSDNIWSVREDAAVALGDFMRAYGDDAARVVEERLPELLAACLTPDEAAHACSDAASPPSSPPAPAESPRAGTHDAAGDAAAGDGALSSSPSEASPRARPHKVVTGSLTALRDSRAARTADAEHSDQQMFSCGSLAPKLRRRGVGCMDHGYTRPKRNWELTDGAVYLVRELATVHPERVSDDLMRALCDAVAARSSQCDLRVTVWRQLVPISTALGKRAFKRHVQGFLAPLLRAQSAPETQLESAAADDLVQHLGSFMGPAILQGRVEMLPDGDALWRGIERLAAARP